ncbi:MAG TPA: DUF2304 domain-containing protein [Lachnospiraceae bacterium]|nr:DUF2304 domain-containing protein [Lachnospiraceae bacterium]
MLRVLLITMSVLSLFYVISKIRNSKMQIEYSIFWILMSFVMIIMSVFPEIVYWITTTMRMISPANVVYLFIIAILLVKSFMMTIEISKLEDKVKDLVQQIGINEKIQKEIQDEVESQIQSEMEKQS